VSNRPGSFLIVCSALIGSYLAFLFFFAKWLFFASTGEETYTCQQSRQ
jgi:hypothetical protein